MLSVLRSCKILILALLQTIVSHRPLETKVIFESFLDFFIVFESIFPLQYVYVWKFEFKVVVLTVIYIAHIFTVIIKHESIVLLLISHSPTLPYPVILRCPLRAREYFAQKTSDSPSDFAQEGAIAGILRLLLDPVALLGVQVLAPFVKLTLTNGVGGGGFAPFTSRSIHKLSVS
jgi:hypothetical protein